MVGPEGWGDEPTDAVPARPDGRARLRLTGFVDEATKAALYEGADVVCYPSLREGFGLPVLEAMAHGAPVVTSRGTATAEVGGDAVVLVDPLDPSDIARGIARGAGARAELAAAGPVRAAGLHVGGHRGRVLGAYREVAP